MSLFPNYATTVGFQQLDAISAATKLTVPSGATYCMISVETTSVRYRSDGVAPTASVGVLLPITTGQPYMLAGGTMLTNLQFIPTASTATLNIEYYR